MRKHLWPVCFILFFVGCLHPGKNLEQVRFQADGFEVSEVLADLSANEQAIRQFRATGRFTLKTPDLDTIYHLPQSSFSFARPAQLTVIGRKYATTVLRLYCDGPAFLIELPTEKSFLYRPEGAQVAALNKRISPVDILAEMFFSEEWTALSPKQVRLESYDSQAQRAVLAIYGSGPRAPLHRRVWVLGAPWVVEKSELYASDGALMAVTRKEGWRELEGVRFPVHIESRFPTESAEMIFDLRKVFLNEASPLAVDIPGRVAVLLDKGYQEASLETGVIEEE